VGFYIVGAFQLHEFLLPLYITLLLDIYGWSIQIYNTNIQKYLILKGIHYNTNINSNLFQKYVPKVMYRKLENLVFDMISFLLKVKRKKN
jgi:hypothetical protein